MTNFTSHSQDNKILGLAYTNEDFFNSCPNRKSKSKRLDAILKPLCDYYHIDRRHFKKNGDIPFNSFDENSDNPSSQGGSLSYHWDITWAPLVYFIYNSLQYNPFYLKYKKEKYEVTLENIITYYRYLYKNSTLLPKHIKHLLEVKGFNTDLEILCTLEDFPARYSEIFFLNTFGFTTGQDTSLNALLYRLTQLKKSLTPSPHTKVYTETYCLNDLLPLYNVDMILRDVLLYLFDLSPQISFRNPQSNMFKKLDPNSPQYKNLDKISVTKKRQEYYLDYLHKLILKKFPISNHIVTVDLDDKYIALIHDLKQNFFKEHASDSLLPLPYLEDIEPIISQDKVFLSLLSSFSNIVSTCLSTYVEAQFSYLRKSTPKS